MDTLFLTKEARIYNGAKIASSINGAGKTEEVKKHLESQAKLALEYRMKQGKG